MLLALFEYFNLLFGIYYLALVTEYCLEFSNKLVLISDICFFFKLILLFLGINASYTLSKLG